MLKFKNREIKAGLSPGTLLQRENVGSENPGISVFTYNAETIEETTVSKMEDLTISSGTNYNHWINIDSLDNISVIERIGEMYKLHPLMLEDIVSTDQRPKLDEYEDNLYLVLRMLSYNTEKDTIQSEQVSFILGKNYLLSFQEKKGDVFSPNRNRLRSGKGKMRKSGTDYLMYSLLDTVVDNYFIILERLGEKLERLEDTLIANPNQEKLKKLYALRREIIFLKKSVWPLREVVNKLEREENNLIRKSTKIYIRDVYDHTIQIIENIESFRETLSSLMDIYLSSISNKTNAVMKVLTIISTIFIPLTFIAGVYGMNFENMPELKWRYGYIAVWMVMISVFTLMMLFFKRKKWF